MLCGRVVGITWVFGRSGCEDDGWGGGRAFVCFSVRGCGVAWMTHARAARDKEPRIILIIISSSSSRRRPPTTTRCSTFPSSTATRCSTFPPPYSYQQPISRRPSTDTRRWTFPTAVFVSPADQPIAAGILSADARRWTFPAEATKTPHPTSPHLTSPHLTSPHLTDDV